MILKQQYLAGPKGKARLLFAVLSVVVFSPVLFRPGVFNIDNYLLESLKNLTSFGDYFSGIATAKVHDIQPLRDLSYAWDLWVQGMTGLTPFTFTNLLIWIVTGFVLIDLFEKLASFKDWTGALLVIAFLMHPLFGQSVILVAARKHLLAFLFISLFLREVLVRKNYSGKAILYFLLSLLSHPLNIGLSLWLMIHLKVKESLDSKEVVKKAWPLLMISVAIGLVNWWWYFGVYEPTLGITRHEGGFSLGDTFLAFGRYASLIFIPDSYATFYGKQSVLNLVGLVVLPLVFWVFFKKVGKSATISFGSLFVVSLLPVTYKTFWFFVGHNYILVGLLATLLLICPFIVKVFKEHQKSLLYSSSLVLIIFAGLSFKNSLAYQRPSQVIESNYLTDGNCINLHYYVGDLFDRQQVVKAARLGEEMLLQGLAESALYYKLAQGVFYLNNQSEERALRLLEEVLTKNEKVSVKDTFVKTFVDYCEKNKADQQNVVCSQLKEKAQ